MNNNIIALVYDFDGTLTPSSMQNYTVLPGLGVINLPDFWDEVGRISHSMNAEPNLVWMHKIIQLAGEKYVKLSPEYFRNQAKDIKYYPGIPEFFSRMVSFVREKSEGKMSLRHYIISSGLKEILDGTSIRNHFYNVFGSEYMYNDDGTAFFPKVVITDTVKTQYIFRINKGKENMSESINEYMPGEERPIPFSHIIYVGDGLTDVPAMNVTRKNGGHAIAVYDQAKLNARSTCAELKSANRVDFIAETDYRSDSTLSKYMETLLNLVIMENQG